MFPEQLFVLSQRDQQVTWLDPYLRNTQSTVAAVSVNSGLQVPVDRALLFYAAYAEFIPGAAQNVANNSISLFPASGSFEVKVKRNLIAGAANVPLILDWSGFILLPPTWIIRATAAFNAGAAGNTVELSVAGILIPPANIQRV